MSLKANPFSVLGASVRDNRQRVVELAEERGLEIEPQLCTEAKAALTNPRLRLNAEIGWLPGVSPAKAGELINQTTKKNGVLIRQLSGIPALAGCNLLASAILESQAGNGADQELTFYIRALVQKYGEISVEDLVRLINEDRAVAGFPAILGIDAVEDAMATHKEYLGRTLREGLNKLTEPDTVLTKVVTDLTRRGEQPAPVLLEELTANYRVEVQRYLDELAGQVTRLKNVAVQEIEAGQGKASSLHHRITQLEEVLRQWDRIAQPIQLIAKTRGSDEQISLQLAAEIRGFAIDLANKYQLHEEAQRITSLMADLFADLPQLSDKLSEDTSQLSKLIDEKKEWEQEVALDLMIGSDRLVISPEEITYKGRSVQTKDVDRVRWGVYKQYTNGIRTSRYFTIWVGTPQKTIEIECVRFLESEDTVMKRYLTILDKLWKAVCARLVMETLRRLSAGEKLYYGRAVVDQGGIVLMRHKFLQSEPVYYPWQDLSIGSGSGNFNISATKDSKASVQLSYRDIDNVHILEKVMRFLWEDGNYRKLQNGEFK